MRSKQIVEEKIMSEVESPNSLINQFRVIHQYGNVIEIAMPKMGESVMEGTIIKWYKKVGDTIKKDETIFEISTDKVDTEIPSPEAGTLAEILVGEQETVEVGTIVAKLAVGSDVKVSQQDKQEKVQEQVHVQEDKFYAR